MKETMEVSDATWEIKNDPLKNFDSIFKLYAEKGTPSAGDLSLIKLTDNRNWKTVTWWTS